jgi:hypothetical protein
VGSSVFKHKGVLLVVMLAAVATLTGCADHVVLNGVLPHDIDGFWFGVWHGAILPVSWLFSLFDPDVAIYAINNNGPWYDSGFMLGVGSFLVAGISLNKL